MIQAKGSQLGNVAPIVINSGKFYSFYSGISNGLAVSAEIGQLYKISVSIVGVFYSSDAVFTRDRLITEVESCCLEQISLSIKCSSRLCDAQFVYRWLPISAETDYLYRQALLVTCIV